MLKEYLLRSLRSLMLHRLRTLLSTLGILFGVVAVVAMLSIGEGAKQETLKQIEQLGINTLIIRQNNLSEEQQSQARQKRSRGLSMEDAESIRKGVPFLQWQAPVKQMKASLPGALQDMAPELLAVTTDYAKIKSLQTAEGRFICDSDRKNKSLVCVLGYDVARALGVAGHKGKMLRIGNIPFQILGILHSTEWQGTDNAVLATTNVNQAVFIPLGSEDGLKGPGIPENELLSEIILQAKPQHDLTQIAGVVGNILNRLHGNYQDYQIILPQALLNQAHQTQRTFNLVLGSIATISLLVGGIGIMNMMLANVSERVKEIGIRRALGATRTDIMLQFLTETLILTLSGAIMGAIIGVLSAFAISYFAGWNTIVTIWSLLLSLGMAAGVGVCSGLYPAYQAATLDPIVALRKE